MSSPADTLVARGIAFGEAGQLAESIQCLSDAARLQPSAKVYWHLVHAHMRAKQFEQAQNLCESALALCPGEVMFYQLLAGLKETRGDTAGAVDVLGRAAAAFPSSADLLAEYAHLQMRTMRFAEAIPTLERVIALSPNPGVYRTLYKMRRAIDDLDGARRAMREGLKRFPLDIGLSRYCDSFDPAAAAESRAAMKAVLSQTNWDASIRSPFLGYLTDAQAKENRRAAGLPLNGAADWNDLVQWPDPEGMASFADCLDRELAGRAPRSEALSERAAAAIAQMDWAGAERWYEQARRQQTQTVADVAVFDPEFYRRLESKTDEEISSPFSPVIDVITQGVPAATTLFVACDPKYFDLFVPRLLESFGEHGSDAAAHIHLLDGAEHDWHRIAEQVRRVRPTGISLTAEGGAGRTLGASARDYYHAARFVRFYQYLARAQQPAWLLDADMVALSNPEPMFRLLHDRDFAAASSVTSLEPWLKIRAGVVGIAPTPGGIRYIRLVAAYISHWFQKGGLRWGIDQQALFGSYFYLAQDEAPKTAFLGESFTNDVDGLPCIVRPVMDTTSRWKKA